MSFGSGESRRVRRCATAAGVSVIAAFRGGRSFDARGATGVLSCAFPGSEGGVVGLEAFDSEADSIAGAFGGGAGYESCPVNEDKGVSAFLDGGGAPGSMSVEGLCAVTVCR